MEVQVFVIVELVEVHLGKIFVELAIVLCVAKCVVVYFSCAEQLLQDSIHISKIYIQYSIKNKLKKVSVTIMR